jgi:hypothetical protein
MVAWFLGPEEDTECYFQRLRRLKKGLNTGHWRVYEHEGKLNSIELVLSMDSLSVMVLEGMGWRPFSSMGQAISLLGAKLGEKN